MGIKNHHRRTNRIPATEAATKAPLPTKRPHFSV